LARKCSRCAASCCRYVALEIDKPTSAGDFDDIRWYLAHPNLSVFVEDGLWYLNIPGKCRYLTADHRCRIYEKRPRICRTYKLDECEFDGGADFEHNFTTIAQIEEYARIYLAKKRKRAAAKAARTRRKNQKLRPKSKTKSKTSTRKTKRKTTRRS